ncbi:MAG: hypothetical protein FJZ58_05365 [Chlamydiae bacterium]|nr:hypothetical protein [Chlamydiota bacterium]
MKNKKNKTVKIPTLSLNAKVEQLARFLRSEVKTKETGRKGKQPAISSDVKTPSVGSVNLIQQVAKRLRSEVHAQQGRKKKAA